MISDLTKLTLNRVPPAPSLQAFNAADELALQRLQQYSNAEGPWLLVNDAFGALATALSVKNLDWWNDSAMGREALDHNLAAHKAAAPRIIESPTELRDQYRLVILQAPKSLTLFEWQLSEIGKRLTPDGQCWVLGMVKHLSRGHQGVMQQYFSSVDPGLAVKKARCVTLADPVPKQAPISAQEYSIDGLTLVALPGCFSEAKPDPGALAFLAEFDQLPSVDRLVDLGCGNGVLALSYLRRHPTSQAILIDESLQATASAAASAERNGYPVQIHHANGLTRLGLSAIPLILCNPPFHQSTTLTTDIAHSLFKQAASALSAEGEFWVVGNRHLNYHKTLKRWFTRVTAVSQHPKFVVFRCTVPKP
ncbi:class I SAM-dependent methyltransferase [Saccharospirillum sp.]|uniref:class I SAM-dependent methyltransferase n=1 Tax=Saccharospirillum sp. TaxID=2033801 RepID=UPI00349FE51F